MATLLQLASYYRDLRSRNYCQMMGNNRQAGLLLQYAVTTDGPSTLHYTHSSFSFTPPLPPQAVGACDGQRYSPTSPAEAVRYYVGEL
eukprot:9294097-Pyramimonas_sp.AAC.1